MIHSAPTVAIGGLGGSGTRVLAATLQRFGIRIGERLNNPLDNLWFTVLFKRRKWCSEAPDQQQIDVSIRLFTQAMQEGLYGNVSTDELELLEMLKSDLPPAGSWKCGADSDDAQSLIDSREPDSPCAPWGWKEPNTHLFLENLNRQIPSLKYIHMVRNGLDMAYSGNHWQRSHWGHLFGLGKDDSEPAPVHQLRFWTVANRNALDFGSQHMKGRFLAICYESFCLEPQAHVEKIAKFLDMDPPRLEEDMVNPSTIGRWRNRDLSIFSKEDLAAAEAIQKRVCGQAF